MSNFGVLRLRVVNPYEVAFREARSAVGAQAVLAQAEEYEMVAEAVGDCSLVVGTTAGARRQPQQALRRLDEAAPEIRRHLRSGRVALLFGSEKRGLSNQDFNHCHWLMRIPTRTEHPSMNLGQAVAVCLYELARAGVVPAPATSVKAASAEEVERLTLVLLDVLRASGYVKARTAASSEEKVRRLARRMNLQAADAQVWLGMLRQILWKVSS